MYSKKTRLLSIAVLFVACLSSCHTTKVTVGDLSPKEPMMKVNSEWNHHLIGGLVSLGNTKMKATDYVGDSDRYMIKTNRSFLNGLVGFFTLSLYTPSTTAYYIPLDESSLEGEYMRRLKELDANKKKKKKNFYNGSSEDEVEESVVEEEVVVLPSRKKNKKKDSDASVNTNTNTQTVIAKEPVSETIVKPVVKEQPKESIVAVKTQTQTESVDYKGVIYFKDGAKMDGLILSESNATVVKIKLPSGLVMDCRADEIEKVERKR